MEQKHQVVLGVLLLMFSIGAFAYVINIPVSGDANSQPINYHANVCVYKNGELLECNHNLLYNTGKESIEQVLGNAGNPGPFQNITLCNATAGCGTPVAAGNEDFTAYTNCGLAAGTGGTYASLGTGNWSIYKTFTSTCDNIITNSTRLTNSSGSSFAGNTFTLVTLQSSDSLTINWTIYVQ